VSVEKNSSEYKAFMDALASSENIEAVEDGGPSAADAIARNRSDAALSFPAGFWESLSSGGKPAYELRIEGTKSGVEKALSKIADAALARARLSALPIFRGKGMVSGARADITYHYPTKDFRLIDLVAPSFIAFFLYFITFLLTCVAFLRERSSGTLERILISPISSFSIVFGYLLAFFVLGSVQGGFLMAFSTLVLGIKTVGGFLWALVPMLITVLLGVTMGIFFSELAKNEFQVIQFIPLVIIPQALLSGLIMDVDTLPAVFKPISLAMPLTYTVNIIQGMLLRGENFISLGGDFLALGAFLFGFLGLSLLVARRVR
jgi:ABC-2 type transport system permease protein